MSTSGMMATCQQVLSTQGHRETTVESGRRSRNVVLAAVLALAGVIPLLVTITPWLLTGREIDEFNTIDKLYRSVAIRVSEGAIPYRDFPLEYPVGCLPQLLLPILAGQSIPAYRFAYIAEMLLINAVVLQVLAWQVGRREGEAAVPRRLAWYFLCFAFLCRMIVSRIDLVPALLALLAALEWFGKRPIVGGVLASLGGLVKIFPALIAVPAGLRELLNARQSRLRGSLAFVGCSLLGLLIWFLLGGAGVTSSILYHAERGLEIESLYAGPLMIFGRITGESMAVELGHGSYELIYSRAPAAVAASRYVQVLVLVVGLIPFLASRRRSGAQCACALIVGLILASPVFSPQFVIWVLPLMVVIGGSLGRRVRPLYALICVLTFFLYPVFYHRGLVPLRLPAILLLNVRNALWMVLWGMMVVGADSPGQPASSDPVVY